jgi:hypothetical protein
VGNYKTFAECTHASLKLGWNMKESPLALLQPEVTVTKNSRQELNRPPQLAALIRRLGFVLPGAPIGGLLVELFLIALRALRQQA